MGYSMSNGPRSTHDRLRFDENLTVGKHMRKDDCKRIGSRSIAGWLLNNFICR